MPKMAVNPCVLPKHLHIVCCTIPCMRLYAPFHMSRVYGSIHGSAGARSLTTCSPHLNRSIIPGGDCLGSGVGVIKLVAPRHVVGFIPLITFLLSSFLEVILVCYIASLIEAFQSLGASLS